MLYYKNLSSLFFDSIPREADQFIALTGYVGLSPIQELLTLPMENTVIFGMFKEQHNLDLHRRLSDLTIAENNVSVVYPEITCHSKCYIWLTNNKPIKGLIGSANFSTNGLYNDFRESLFEVDTNQLPVLKGYIDIILDSCFSSADWQEKSEPNSEESNGNPEASQICEMVLYDPRTGETQPAHGLNWGLAEGSNVRPDDANIPIRVDHIKKHPTLFPPKTPNPEKKRGDLVDVVELVWDDGLIMKCRLEGSQPVNGVKYPKQIASAPHKDELGKYLRDRLGLESGTRISRSHLMRYGRDTVSISKMSDGMYFCNFEAL